jgi:hypothetical protein
LRERFSNRFLQALTIFGTLTTSLVGKCHPLQRNVVARRQRLLCSPISLSDSNSMICSRRYQRRDNGQS